MTLGERRRVMQKARGLSQEEVARRSGLSLKGMGDIERGSIEDPHYSSLKNIADALSVSVGILVGEEQQELAPLDEAPSGAGQSREWVDVSGSVKGTANVSGALLAGVND